MWFSKKLGVLKILGCPGIFRESKGNTPKCPGRQISQIGMYALECGERSPATPPRLGSNQKPSAYISPMF